jgi:putative transposase
MRRDVVAHLWVAYDISKRRACVATGFERSSQRYRSKRDPQTALRIRIKDLAAARVRLTAISACTSCSGGKAEL